MTTTQPKFFSIIIPAYNEEKYLQDTLLCLTRLSYPQDRFEVIVVENGSTDRTYDIARSVTGAPIRVIQSTPAGVSRARNTSPIPPSPRAASIL